MGRMTMRTALIKRKGSKWTRRRRKKRSAWRKKQPRGKSKHNNGIRIFKQKRKMRKGKERE